LEPTLRPSDRQRLSKGSANDRLCHMGHPVAAPNGTSPAPPESVADDRPQARPPLLPHPPGARAPKRSSPSADPRHPLRPAHQLTDDKHLPASSRSFCDTRPRAAVNQRPSGRSRSPRIDPSTITSPAPRPSTHISPGARGTIATTPPHNHSPLSLDEGPGSDKQERRCPRTSKVTRFGYWRMAPRDAL
jgi:hypothetical protein